MSKDTHNQAVIERPPIVVVVGHIDHGKSTLLDYIRKENTVADEAGGITQHVSAYEVSHENDTGEEKRITFLDTPGHEAFSQMRSRGCHCADVAILVVSAEDGVKPQTVEAARTIKESGIPYIVAINKIDTPKADIEKTKADLAEHEIYLEGYGGDISFVPISAKEGTGIDELLSLVLLTAELEELAATPDQPGEGIVIESHRDPQRGITASLLIQNGTIETGSFIVTDDGALAKTRIMENFVGEPISSATVSSPIRVVGFNQLPPVGARFYTYTKKKEAEKAAKDLRTNTTDTPQRQASHTDAEETTIPLIIKTDVAGSGDAVIDEIEKIDVADVAIKILDRGVGAITEADIKRAMADQSTIIVGFNVPVEHTATDALENTDIMVKTFSIIYNLTEWLAEEIEKRRPRKTVAEVHGIIKVLKTFSQTKERQVIGGHVTEGALSRGDTVQIFRRDNEIGTGTITELQQQKASVSSVSEDTECGLMIETKTEIASGDTLQAFTVTTK